MNEIYFITFLSCRKQLFNLIILFYFLINLINWSVIEIWINLMDLSDNFMCYMDLLLWISASFLTYLSCLFGRLENASLRACMWLLFVPFWSSNITTLEQCWGKLTVQGITFDWVNVCIHSWVQWVIKHILQEEKREGFKCKKKKHSKLCYIYLFFYIYLAYTNR